MSMNLAVEGCWQEFIFEKQMGNKISERNASQSIELGPSRPPQGKRRKHPVEEMGELEVENVTPQSPDHLGLHL